MNDARYARGTRRRDAHAGCRRKADLFCACKTQQERQHAVKLFRRFQTKNGLHKHVLLQALGYLDTLSQKKEYHIKMPLTGIAVFMIAAKNDSGGNDYDSNTKLPLMTRVIEQAHDGEFTAQRVRAEEFKVLDALGWMLNRPTALSALHLYLEVCRQENKETLDIADEIEKECDKVCWFAMLSGVSRKYLPTTVAAASIVEARRSTAFRRGAENMEDWTTEMTSALGPCPEHLIHCLADLNVMMRHDETDQEQDDEDAADGCRKTSDEPPTKQRKLSLERVNMVQVGAA